MNIPFFATIGYVLITLLIGVIMARRQKGIREFFVAGGQLPWVMLVPFLMAEYLASSSTVGAVEMAHESGIISFSYSIGAILGLIVLAFGLVKFYKVIKKITLGEAFLVLFDTKTRLAAVILLLGCTTLTMGTSYLALAAILAPMFNISYEIGVWLSVTLFIVIAATGGLRSIAWMNIVHLVVIVASFTVATIASVNAAGGLGDLLASLPPEHFDFFRLGEFTTTAWLIGGIGVKLISPIAVTAMFAAKDEKSAKIGALSTGVFLVLFAFLPTLIGLSAYTIMPNISSRLALWEMGEYCGLAVSTIVSIGVIGALISTTPPVLLALGGLATRDIFLLIRPKASEKSQLAFSRIIIPIIGYLGAWFALYQSSILTFALRIFQVRAIIAVPLLIAVLWRRVQAVAAFWSVVLGAGGGLIWFLSGSPFGIEPLWPGIAMGILPLIIISLRKKPSHFRGVDGLEIT